MPDEELFRLAARGALRRRENLRSPGPADAPRSSRSQRLSENFAGQWLQTRSSSEFVPDPVLFPEFDESLRSAMLEETQLFCRVDPATRTAACWTSSTPITRSSTSDWPGTTASPASSATRFAGSRSPARRRGGVLTQASVLAVDVQPDAHLAGEAGQVDPGEHPGHAAVAAAVGRGGPQGEARRRVLGHAPRADGAAPDRPVLRLVPPADGPARIRPRELRRRRRLADRTTDERADRSVRQAPRRAASSGAGRAAGRTPVATGCVRPLPRREDAHLCPGPRPGTGRPPRRRPDRRQAGPDGYRFSALVLAIVESAPFQSRESTGGRP